VSQYADINFAIKKFSSGKWYWLSQIGHSGYLVFLPKTPIVWIDEQFKRSYKIQMRVSSSIYNKPTVLIASLNMGDGLLRLEDTWLVSDKNHRQNPFTQRWNTLLEFYSVAYKCDTVLQQGLRIETAVYNSLTSINDMQHIPNIMIAQGETEKRRLRVQLLNSTATPPISAKPSSSASASASTPPLVPKVKKMPEGQALAVPHPEYPDTYELLVDGVKKGFAAVQDIDLSKRLKVEGQSSGIRVKIEWNAEFSMYEIQDII
jgi:hypothetical protein